MSQVGHNNPPDMIEVAVDTARSISEWMKENPVIEKEEAAREAKLLLDRGRLTIKDLKDELDKQTRPISEQLESLRDRYRSPRSVLEKVIGEIQTRISEFIRVEEQKRIAAAQEAARIAQEAERKAREAEAAEREALASASSGELGIDVQAHVSEADASFKEYQKAARQAAVAERETKVKIGGGFSRSVSLASKEKLTVTDLSAAIKVLGATPDIQEAVLKSARAYKRMYGEYPAGVSVEIERKVR